MGLESSVATEWSVGADLLAAFRSWLLSPEGLAKAEEALLRFLDIAKEVLTKLQARFESVLTAARRVTAKFPEPRVSVYEELLIDSGCKREFARFMSMVAFKLGTSLADEINSERRALGTALRKLKAATGGTTLVISRRARALLETLDRYPAGGLTAIAIRESGLVLTLDEFREIVLRASTRDQQACEQLGNVVPPIFQHFPKARGKALSAPTATHALLLMLLHDSGNPQAYTYDYGADDFVDPATLATRRAFEQQRFSPCRARRLFNELESA
jgi:hypothetical protein